MAFGTNTTLDLLASRFQYVNVRISDFGERNVADGVQSLVDSYNAQVADIVGGMVGFTTERFLTYGSGDTLQAQEMDELGTPLAQKPRAGVVVGFPLKKYGYAWQGTRQYLKKATVGEVMLNALAIMNADQRNLVNEFRKAIFLPTNYTFSDDLVDHITATPLPVKRLLNADGLAIPPGPNGESFDGSTHTHYLGTSSFVAADMVALERTVLEHFNDGSAMFCIPSSLATTIATFTGNFVADTPVQILQPTTAASLVNPGLDVVSINNRMIGYFDGIPVWIKPWMPTAKVLFVLRKPGMDLVKLRTDPDTAGGGALAIDFKDENYALRAEFWAREYGMGVQNRHSAAALDTANASYTSPTLTSY